MRLDSLAHAVRRLARDPGHSTLAVLTLALGIGLTAAMLAIVEGTFLRGLPFPDGERIVRIERLQPDATGVFPFATREAVALRGAQTSFDILGAWTGFSLNLSGSGEPAEPYNAGYVTADLLAMTGVRPILGRPLRPEDERAGAPSVIVLSGELWRSRFGGDPRVVGRTVRVAGEPATVIGVMPAGFRFPLNQYFWLPLRFDEAERKEYRLQLIGRLRAGIAPQRARAEIANLVRHLPSDSRAQDIPRIAVLPFLSGYVDEDLRSRQLVMLGAVCGVLLIACVNVANLLLVRSARRTPEIAVRSALGAGRARLATQLLAETLVLAAAGGALGLGLAQGLIVLYRRLLGDEIPSFWVDVRLDARVIFCALGLTLLASLLAGMVPALRAARTDPGEILQDSSRGSTSLRLGRFGAALAVAEIALSCALLVPTGLTVKSLMNLARLDLGFPPERVLTAEISIYGPAYEDVGARRRYYAELGRRLAGLPGAPPFAFLSSPPLGSRLDPKLPLAVEGFASAAGTGLPSARWFAVSPGYFEIFGLRRLAGRTFTETDGAGALPVTVVSRSFAERFLPGGSPVGRRIRAGGGDRPWCTVVGVVADLSFGGLDGGRSPAAMYFSWEQSRPWGGVLAVRSAGPLSPLAAAIRRAAVAADPEVPVWALATMQERIDGMAGPFTRAGALFGLFGAVGLFLAALGLYGVMAAAVTRRRREIGIRLALGASGAAVQRGVLRSGAVQLAVGIALGLALAAALARLLAASLYQVHPWDLGVYALAPAVLAVAGLLACWLPARRAARVDPLESLRAE
jgi:putative ABC transport system permease protein